MTRCPDEHEDDAEQQEAKPDHERRADPEDGRACLLVPTAKGEAVLSEHNAIRLQHFTGMLDGWSDADLRTFADLLQRFTDDFDNANHDWLSEQFAATRTSAERN